MNLQEFRDITKRGNWNNYASLLCSQNNHPLETIEQFSTYWIEAGHKIREQISDDRLLVSLLRHMLPAYQGNAVKLYRGENQERWNTGKIGLAWTLNIDVAKMFGRGLNSNPNGGILLEANFESKAIICGPNSHSTYLGEEQFTIDPFYITSISVIEKFLPCN